MGDSKTFLKKYTKNIIKNSLNKRNCGMNID